MSDRAEDLAQSLSDVEDALVEINEAISEALSAREYEDLIGVKADLLRDRQAIVEALEEIGLEDPDL